MLSTQFLNINSLHKINHFLHNQKHTSTIQTVINNKNFILCRFFSNFKRVVKKQIQFNLFHKTTISYIRNVSNNLFCILKLFNYVEHNIDVWYHYSSFKNALFLKIKELYTNYHISTFLYSFHLKCNYTTKKNKLCTRNCYKTYHQCKQHLQLQLKTEQIMYEMKVLPSDLIHIVNKYMLINSY